MSDDALADALIGPKSGSGDRAMTPTRGMVCTAWNPTTRQNTVTDGAVTYTDLAYCGNPAEMTTGRCLVIQTGGRPVILGPLYTPTA